MVLLLHRPALSGRATDRKSSYPTEGLGIAIVAKHRNGETGEVYFSHNKSLTRKGDYTPGDLWMTRNATDTAKEFKAATCIRISRVRFSPGEMLRDMCKAMKYSLYKADTEGGNRDTPKPDENPGGGSTGGDDDEAPDPTV